MTNPIFQSNRLRRQTRYHEQIGIPSAVLMERAALAVADALFDHYDLTKVLSSQPPVTTVATAWRLPVCLKLRALMLPFFN